MYASQKLPITVCFTEHVDEVYNTLLGSKYLAVPSGSASRMEKWPPLESVGDFDFVGGGLARTLGDIVLSSAGKILELGPLTLWSCIADSIIRTLKDQEK